MNVKWQTIADFYKDNRNNYPFDLELYEYEIINNLLKDNNIETVKTIGGGPNLDFFIYQTDTNIKECVNIDIYKEYRGFDVVTLQNKYKDLFGYQGKYKFLHEAGKDRPVFGDYYDCIVDDVGPEPRFELDYTLTNPPKIFILVHQRHVEQLPWCFDFDKTMPMQFATKNFCVYSFESQRHLNEYCKVRQTEFRINNRYVPVIQRPNKENEDNNTKNNNIENFNKMFS